MRKVQVRKSSEIKKRPLFHRPAGFVYSRYLSGKKGASMTSLEEAVISLHTGRKSAAAEYQIEKISQVMFVSAVLLVIFIAVLAEGLIRDRTVPDNRLERNGYGSTALQVDLEADVEHESEEQIYPVHVGPRRYTASQAAAMLEEARDDLERMIIGDNPSGDHVERDLVFPETFQDGAVAASYLTVPYGIISEQGHITGKPEKEGTLVEIKATLSCQEEMLIFETAVMVYPKTLSGAEALQEQIRSALREADEEQALSEHLDLPGMVSGRRIRWKYPASGAWKIALLWLIGIPPLIWFAKDARVRARAKERERQLGMDYPEILWRMTMLLGAGMGVRQAFTRIASGYEKNRAGGAGKRYAYEEMLYTIREMQTGTGEAAAYERFGRRCGLPGYVKLGSLLTTSVRKVTADLRRTLEKEAALSMEERKNLALSEGERAGTRMLFPMIIMLGVVIAVLIVPAFISMM